MLSIRLYRWVLSPAKSFLFGANAQCRFSPSCSSYALKAIETHGACAGSWLALKRVARCHPWGGCGEDPVPPKGEHRMPEASALAGKIPDSTSGDTRPAGPSKTAAVPLLKSAA